MGRVLEWVQRITPWFSVLVLVLTGVLLAFPAWLQVDALRGGGGDIWLLVVLLVAEAVIAVMCVLGVYSIMPQRLPLSQGTVTVLGIAAFGGMFFLILLILRGQIYAAVPILVYFVRIRRDLADQLPIAAGGRRMPGARDRKKRRDPEAVTSRPPRSWDPDGGARRDATRRNAGGRSASGAKRRRKRKH